MKTPPIISYVEELSSASGLVAQRFQDVWAELYPDNVIMISPTGNILPEWLVLFESAVARYPTVNAKDYEMTCYRRWPCLYFFMLKNNIEGAWILDYDVLPNKEKPKFSFPTITKTTSYEHVACCYWLREDLKAFIHLLQSIPPWQIDRRHMSDMTIFDHKFRPPAGYEFSVTNYPDTRGDLIHFSGCHNKTAMLAY